MLMPKDDTEEFEFYLKFCKPLIFHMLSLDERLVAALWMKRLRLSDKPEVKIAYLKILIFLILKRKLLGPFAERPPKDNNSGLPFPIPREYALPNIAKNYIFPAKFPTETYKKYVKTKKWPPCSSAYSSDLKEYAAVQLIPNFGVHGYLAMSNEPLSTWNNFEKARVPEGEFVKDAEWSRAKDVKRPQNITCFVAPEYLPKGKGDATEKEHFCPSSKYPMKAGPIGAKFRAYGCLSPSEQTLSLKIPESGASDIVDSLSRGRSSYGYPVEGMERSCESKMKRYVYHHEIKEGDREPPTWGSNLINCTKIISNKAEKAIVSAPVPKATCKFLTTTPNLYANQGDPGRRSARSRFSNELTAKMRPSNKPSEESSHYNESEYMDFSYLAHQYGDRRSSARQTNERMQTLRPASPERIFMGKNPFSSRPSSPRR